MTKPPKYDSMSRRPGRPPPARPLTPEEIEYNRRLAIRLKRKAEVNEAIGYTNSPARTGYEHTLDILSTQNRKKEWYHGNGN